MNRVKWVIGEIKGGDYKKKYLSIRSIYTLRGRSSNRPKGLGFDRGFPALRTELNKEFDCYQIDLEIPDVQMARTVGELREVVWGKMPQNLKIEDAS